MAPAAYLLPQLLPALLLAAACQAAPLAPAAPFATQEDRLEARHLAIVINDDDPDSVAVGDDYRRRRAIPGRPHALEPARFRQLKADIDSRLRPQVQGVLMVWTAPFKVGCHGIAGAHTLGYDGALCADTCAAGRPSPLVNAPGRHPMRDHGLRPAMLLPIASRQAARALIDRGIVSGLRRMPTHAWYLTSSEAARNARAAFFPAPGYRRAQEVTVHRLQADALQDAGDVLVCQLGRAQLERLDSVRLVPGALADHSTSQGGELLVSGQMSSLRWLAAGATASDGTVGVPCKHWQKFPNPGVLLRRYRSGASAIDACWNSVAWPAQGVFIGEPLAAPFARHSRTPLR